MVTGPTLEYAYFDNDVDDVIVVVPTSVNVFTSRNVSAASVTGHEVSASVRPLIESNHNTLSLEVDAGIPSIVGDAMRVRQIVLNLVSNATKFTSSGTIHVRAQVHGAWVRIDVRDTGIGMTPEEISRLFREFSQADASTTRKYGGSGLGLAISQRLARLMGGDLTATSEVGVGSSFFLWLENSATRPPVVAE